MVKFIIFHERLWGITHCIVANVLDCNIVISEFLSSSRVIFIFGLIPKEILLSSPVSHVIAWLEFELAYDDVTVQHVSR